MLVQTNREMKMGQSKRGRKAKRNEKDTRLKMTKDKHKKKQQP